MATDKKPNRMRQTFSSDEPKEESLTEKVGDLVHKATEAVASAFNHDETAKATGHSPKKHTSSEKHKDIKQHSKFDKFKKGHLNGNE